MAIITDDVDARQAGIKDAWRQLRALRVAEVAGWTSVLASDLADGRHILDLGDGHPRTLRRDEVFWWAVGLGDAANRDGDLVLAVEGERVPELLTLEEAAERIPPAGGLRPLAEQMTAKGVEYLIRSGDLYPLYAPVPAPAANPVRRRRYVFALQVASLRLDRRLRALEAETQPPPARDLAAARKARGEWMAVRALLPDAIRPSALSVDVTPRPSPSPLPVTGAQAATRQRRALLIGDKRGWFSFLHQTDGGGWLVELGGLQRVLPEHGVLPWVLGVADQHRQGARVAWRDGLG